MSIPPQNTDRLVAWLRVNVGSLDLRNVEGVFKSLQRSFANMEKKIGRKQSRDTPEKMERLQRLKERLQQNDLYQIFRETEKLNKELR